MYKFQDDYYGEDYYGEDEDYGVDAEEEEEEVDAEEEYYEEDGELAEHGHKKGLGAAAMAWGLVPVIDIALGVFFMTETSDQDNSAW